MTDNDKPMDRLLKAAFEAIRAMTPEERREAIEAQKRSWVRAEMEMGDEGTRPKLDGAAQ